MAIYIDFVTDPYAAPGSKTAMLFFYSGLRTCLHHLFRAGRVQFLSCPAIASTNCTPATRRWRN